MIRKYLFDKILGKEIVAGVIGLGYVGLPLAVEIAMSGFSTIGFEVQQDKIQMLKNGETYIQDVDNNDIKKVLKDGLFRITSNYNLLNEVDFVAICVPTPLDAYKQPDISYILSAVKEMSLRIKKDTMVVLESTTYPRTTEDIVKPLIEEYSGLICCKDFYLAYSPERVDPGNKDYKTKNIPKVVGAIGEDALFLVTEMYKAFLDSEIISVSSPVVAEMSKILENTYRNINIGLVNEFAMLCNKMDINIWEVIDAAKSKPYGFNEFYPGPGLGGHCIPLDPYYLCWKSKQYDFRTTIVESSLKVNEKMPIYCVERVDIILRNMDKKLYGAKILIIGIAYKQDVNDCRESPALKIFELLKYKGANVTYYDPGIGECLIENEIINGERILEAELLRKMDLIIITTAHSSLNYKLIHKYSKMIFDTKNVLKDISIRENIEVL